MGITVMGRVESGATGEHVMTSESMKAYARSLGADLVGVADAARFEAGPRGHRPGELLPGARAVVVIGVRLLKSLVRWDRLFRDSELFPAEVAPRIAQSHVYIRTCYETVNARLEQLAMSTACRLEDQGAEAMFLPATYAHHAPLMEQVPGMFAPFSHRHAAVRAGLGEFGLNDLVLTPEYGPRVRFISVITTAALDPDPLLSEPLCLREACRACVDACELNAIQPRDNASDPAPFLDMPSTINKETCLRRHGEAMCQGRCIAVCPVGQ
jgi:epoxyqueuosine reductase